MELSQMWCVQFVHVCVRSFKYTVDFLLTHSQLPNYAYSKVAHSWAKNESKNLSNDVCFNGNAYWVTFFLNYIAQKWAYMRP